MSRADDLSLRAIRSGAITVDTESGVIVVAATGNRAEWLDKRTAYGRVWVSRRPPVMAMAHRIIWIAAHGLIPDGIQINHLNRRRWDNRIANLELVAPSGNVRHSRGSSAYDAVGASGNVPVDWLERLDGGDREPVRIDPYRRGKVGRAFLVS